MKRLALGSVAVGFAMLARDFHHRAHRFYEECLRDLEGNARWSPSA